MPTALRGRHIGWVELTSKPLLPGISIATGAAGLQARPRIGSISGVATPSLGRVAANVKELEDVNQRREALRDNGEGVDWIEEAPAREEEQGE